MKMQLQCEDFSRYMESGEVIDFETSPEIVALAREINASSQGETDFVKNAFEYVRDEISHSNDIGAENVNYKVSDVLREKHGVCYAKAHLLAAILRCYGVPAGLCYQRLILDDETAPYFVLHGLNAVFIKEINKWIRLDPRGNKVGVNAQFSLEREQLAFPIRKEKGEKDIPVIYAVPNENVVRALIENKNIESLWQNLPAELSAEGE
jgi:transglutaminase-like putative cysteine protease